MARYAKLNPMDTVNGPGIRVTVFFQGCNIHCKGCFNTEAWDFNKGKDFNNIVTTEIIEYLKPDYIKGLSILGGEPMDKQNQEAVKDLIHAVRETFGNSKDIWLWTGYELEDLKLFGKQHMCITTNYILKNINTIVTGPFKLELRDISKNNLWRGSTNQKVIKLR